MSTTDEEYIDPADVVEEPEGEHVEETDERSPEEKQAAELADLRGKVEAAMQGRGDLNELVTLGKAFLANQERANAPKPEAPPGVDMKALGKKIRETLLTAEDDEQAAQMFATLSKHYAKDEINAALSQYGAPMAERAGNSAVRDFLADKRDEATTETEKNLHRGVAKRFTVNAAEKQWLASASNEQANAFLENRYRTAGGDFLFESAKRPRPKDISGGGRGSSTAGQPFPGLQGQDADGIAKLAATLWPDPVERAKKIKAMQAQQREAS